MSLGPARGASKPQGPVGLRRDAETISGALPPLLAEAEQLAATVAMGVHGRRRPGHGENFWQYRQAMPGDSRGAVDWRRSGRSDLHYIREMEWEAAQSVSLWVDDALSMDYRSRPGLRSKAERARLIALALGVLLTRAGERVALMGTSAAQPRSGRSQLNRMAMVLATPRAGRADYGAPPADRLVRGGRAVFFSDFLGETGGVLPALARAGDAGVRGCFVQILDDAEEAFPFDGRMIFESVGRTVDFETQRARGLRDAYLARLAERRGELAAMAGRLGWRCLFHRTGQSPRAALLWLYMALGAGR